MMQAYFIYLLLLTLSVREPLLCLCKQVGSRPVTRRLAWDPTCLLLSPSFLIKNKQNLKGLKSRQYNLFLENYPAFKGLTFLFSRGNLIFSFIHFIKILGRRVKINKQWPNGPSTCTNRLSELRKTYQQFIFWFNLLKRNNSVCKSKCVVQGCWIQYHLTLSLPNKLLSAIFLVCFFNIAKSEWKYCPRVKELWSRWDAK